MSDLRERVLGVIRERALLRMAEPVQLASGEMSRDFVDAKAGLSRGFDLADACRAMVEGLDGLAFDAVGGLTMGADQFAHVIAVQSGAEWFVVRKEPKGRGTGRLVEGAAVGDGTRVLLVDDVVTTGGSIQRAYHAIADVGAVVVAAVTLIDRGEVAGAFFAARGVPYLPFATYQDLGIDPVGPPSP